ncbi:hypothetical protein C8J57DRAFT_1418178 [Mycena rebaudengoi]|nr:hypothetical protein C8J57DRAFT_1418178 [Mycena rebaudengoi]
MKKQDSGSHPPTRKPGGRNPLRFAPLALILVLLWNATLISQAVDGSIRHCFNLKGILRRPNILIRSNSTLQWVACPDNSTFYCSFFSVPLDYSTPSDEDKTAIAMRMYPSTAPKTARLGSIFTNPGGPGGSGHASLLKTGPLLSAIFEGKFDIISWDPRGVNMTTPRISCHPTHLHRELYSLAHESGDLDFQDSSLEILNKTLLTLSARAQLLTDICRDAVGDKIPRSVTTVNVARDLEEMRKAVGDGGLHYWGFSYGTTLGATYAAMFPEQSEKVVLDGVVYAPEQYTSLVDHGLSAGKSTNGVFEGFISNCLSDRIWGLASKLEVSHLPVTQPASKSPLPAILHPGHLISAIFSAMYRPNSWSGLAEAIAAAEIGDGRKLAELSGAGGANWDAHVRNITDAQRAMEAGWGPDREMGQSEAGMAVSCGDAPPFEVGGDQDTEAWTKVWMGWRDQLAAPNRLGGPGWFEGVVRCRHWGRVQPSPDRYKGSWTMGQDLQKPKYVAIDPITPIGSGRRMVATFGKENARLLHNNGYGHCSTNHPSVCIAKAIKAYMINGTLFAEGTICEPDDGIMFPKEGSKGKLNIIGLDEEEQQLTQIMRLLSNTGIGAPNFRTSAF